MDKQPLVSILIPLYNSEKYISETIQSCLNQTYKNIEIIIVDDGSADKSLSIAQSFAKKHNNINIFSQENKGAPAARNKAFELSKGEYIQYLDADDIISENKIENQLNLFEKYGNNIIVSCKWDRFYDNIQETTFPDRVTYKNYLQSIDWIIDVIEKNDMGQTSVWLSPRKLIEMSGMWNEELTVNQDGEFFARVILKAQSVMFCKNAFVYYRSGISGSVSNTSKHKAESLLKSYILIETFLLAKENSARTRHACYLNYLSFIYSYYSYNEELVDSAKRKIQALGYKKLKPVGGKNFKFLAKLIGFENALKFRKKFSKTREMLQRYSNYLLCLW